jgi:hypothetical protein
MVTTNEQHQVTPLADHPCHETSASAGARDEFAHSQEITTDDGDGQVKGERERIGNHHMPLDVLSSQSNINDKTMSSRIDNSLIAPQLLCCLHSLMHIKDDDDVIIITRIQID